MSISLLYHAFGIRGYQSTRTEYQGGRVVFTIHQAPEPCRCGGWLGSSTKCEPPGRMPDDCWLMAQEGRGRRRRVPARSRRAMGLAVERGPTRPLQSIVLPTKYQPAGWPTSLPS
jgi:hypothetical protein